MYINNMDAIYARQSIDKKDSLSIETQISLAKNIALGEPILYIDRGISGKDVVHRPEFQKLLGDIKNGLINRILVYKLDRFTRSLLDFANIWEFMCKYKVEFISVTESFDTSTPIGKAMIFIMAIFAQMEREQISKRVYDNYYDRIGLGRWPGGPAPYGYSNSTISHGDQSISSLKIEDTMYVLDDLMKVYAYPTTSIGDLKRLLLKEKCPGPSSKNWTTCSLSRVLRNPVSVKCDHAVYSYYKNLGVNMLNSLEEYNGKYGGILVGKKGAVTNEKLDYKNTTFAIGNWPGYIDSELWIRCQRKLDGNQKAASNSGPRNSWLSGLIKCGDCGRAISVRKYKRESDGVTVRCMRCSGKQFLDCNIKLGMRIENIEQAVQEELMVLLDQCKSAPVESIHSTNEIEIDLIKVNEAISNLMQVIKSNSISNLTIDYINRELEELNCKKNDLQLQKEKVLQELMIPEKIIFTDLSKEDKRAVAYSYVESVIIYNNSVKIIWKR